MTAAPPPSPRVPEFVDHLRTAPPEPPPSSGRPVSWLLKRVGLAAAIGIGLFLASWLFGLSRVCACTPDPNPSAPIEGFVVKVDSEGAEGIRGFDLSTSGGYTYGFRLGQLDSQTQLSPSDLASHEASGEAIRVFWRPAPDGAREVYRLEDVPE